VGSSVSERIGFKIHFFLNLQRITPKNTKNMFWKDKNVAEPPKLSDPHAPVLVSKTSTSTIWLYTSGRIFTSQAVRLENRL
jgi:hypothetical protein